MILLETGASDPGRTPFTRDDGRRGRNRNGPVSPAVRRTAPRPTAGPPLSARRRLHPRAVRPRHAAARPACSVRRALAVLAVGVVTLFASAVAAVQTLTEMLGGDVPRIPGAFTGLDGTSRPPPAGGLTFLLVGIDTRSDDPAASNASATDGSRSDVLMIVRLFEDGSGAALASIPRDSWVDVPGHGMNKIKVAYARGGPSLLVKTVENLTALRIDHFAKVDFAGFRSVVDAVGGIDVGISAATSNEGFQFRQGVNHLDGAAALAYVRQRDGLADGDLDRAQRQQNALRSVLAKVATTGTLDDPVGLYGLLDSADEFVSVDDTLSNGGLRSLVQEMRGLPADDVSFVRAPVSTLGRQDDRSVVHLEEEHCRQLWEALRTGALAAYVDQHADDTLGTVTR